MFKGDKLWHFKEKRKRFVNFKVVYCNTTQGNPGGSKRKPQAVLAIPKNLQFCKIKASYVKTN